MSYIRGFNPIWSYVDLTGKQFDDTYYMFVLQNTLPYLPATVYHEPDGTPWNNPIQFLANGTLPEDIFFDPGSDANPNVYRLEFRKGNTQADPLIYLVENYIPGQEGGGTPSDIGFTTDNQITNPQFSLVNFTSPLTISSTSSLNVEIAHGWVLELNISSGTGTAVINQVALNNTALTPTNAPYALRLTLSSWDSVKLKQRFQQNGVLWANKIVSCAVTAKVQGLTQTISAELVASDGTPLGFVLNNEQINGSFNEVTGHLNVPISTNANLPPNAWIEFQLLLQPNIDIFLTSFQLIAGDLELEYPFEQDSIDRQIDHTFHYFKPKLEYKPIPSYLVGWDFPLNPAQFGDTITLNTAGVNKSIYMWDQTIVYQTADGGVAQVASSRAVAGNLALTTVGTTQFALIQYLDATKAHDILVNNLSVMVRMACAVGIKLTVSLWYTTNATLPTVPSTFITGLDANGFPTVSANWFEVPRTTGQKATFTAPSSINDSSSLVGFNGWSALTAATAGTAKFFAIVIGTGNTSNIVAEFASISLVPGDIPTIPAPQTSSEVLRDCRRYYEMTYDDPAKIGQISFNDATFMLQSSYWAPNTASSFASPFTLTYREQKRVVPNIVFYTDKGLKDNVNNYLIFVSGGVTAVTQKDMIVTDYWTELKGLKSSNYLTKNIAVVQSQATTLGSFNNASGIRFNCTIDARFGVV